jgi:hypothetical protein
MAVTVVQFYDCRVGVREQDESEGSDIIERATVVGMNFPDAVCG